VTGDVSSNMAVSPHQRVCLKYAFSTVPRLHRCFTLAHHGIHVTVLQVSQNICCCFRFVTLHING